LFCYITSHWKGQPLISVEAIIDLIGSTTTTTGLKVKCVRDNNIYQIGIKVSDEELELINITRDTVCPNWNYSIAPNR
jgi:1-aminocyclopropane-1-carboxylate deaminase/D-cysteine desulfhydrase-like pyridoxal-dependent ACC family enzyme